MKKVLIFAFFLSSFSAQAATTFGNSDCGKWLNGNFVSKAWLAGYMSGLSAGLSMNPDPLDKVDSVEQLFVWMDNYCRKNPLSKVNIGAIELFRELELKK